MKKSKSRNMKASSKLSLVDAEPSNPAIECRKDILIEFDKFSQLYENLDVSDCLNLSEQLNTRKLIKKLEKMFNFGTSTKSMRFYLEEGKVWIKCPRRGLDVEQEDYQHNQLHIQLFEDKELIDAVLDDSNSSANEDDDLEEYDMEGKCRRLKERKIKNVIEKVLKWRELYAGVQDGRETQKISLEEGAKIVNISKKTLDDYLSQIKKGKKYGFNFNDHKYEKVGVLREFIRKMEKKRKVK